MITAVAAHLSRKRKERKYKVAPRRIQVPYRNVVMKDIQKKQRREQENIVMDG